MKIRCPRCRAELTVHSHDGALRIVPLRFPVHDMAHDIGSDLTDLRPMQMSTVIDGETTWLNVRPRCDLSEAQFEVAS